MKYLIYARVSPKGSTWSGGETSISEQIEECTRYIRARDADAEIEVREDELISAATANRPAYASILDELDNETAKWDVLAVRHMDRLSRSLVDAAPLIESLRDAGKGLIAVLQNLDLSTPTGRAMLWIILTFAQWEREILGERVKAKMVAIAKGGGIPYGRAPLGYQRSGRKHDNVLQVDPDGAAKVRRIFREYLSGVSATEIAKDEGLPSRTGVYAVLKRKIYTGVIAYDGEEYPGKHKPLISLTDFEAAQKKLPGKKYNRPRPGAQKHPYILSGLLRCQCGGPLSPGSAHGRSRRYHYYACRNSTCNRFPAAKLESLIVDAMQTTQVDRDDVETMLSELHALRDEEKKTLAPDIKATRKRVRELEKKEDTLVDALISPNVNAENADTLNDRLYRATQQLKSARAALAELESRTNIDLGVFASVAETIQALRDFRDIANATGDSPEALRNFLLAHVDRIEFDGSHFHIFPTLDAGSSKRIEWRPKATLNEPCITVHWT